MVIKVLERRTAVVGGWQNRVGSGGRPMGSPPSARKRTRSGDPKNRASTVTTSVAKPLPGRLIGDLGEELRAPDLTVLCIHPAQRLVRLAG